MIVVRNLTLRRGPKVVLQGASVTLNPGEKIGLVGRNGAGKTTLTKILAGEALPAAGTVTASGEIGYLPQDPRTGDPELLARDRILNARSLGDVVRRIREQEETWLSPLARMRELPGTQEPTATQSVAEEMP